MHRYFLIILTSLSSLSAFAQTKFSAGRAIMVGVSGSIQEPGGDWTKHFSTSSGVGLEAGWKSGGNYLLSLEGVYGFGGAIKNREAVIGHLTTQNGNLINLNGNFATLTLYQRSVYTNFNLEKVFNFWRPNRNSGPIFGIGAGYLWHWIRIDNAGNDSPQINDNYEHGYDQLGQGPLTKQSIGYLYLSPNRKVNFKLSFEFMQAFTQNVRAYHYGEGYASDKTQLNLNYGFKITWYLPIYQGGKTQEYYTN